MNLRPVIVALLSTGPVSAQHLDVDWKYFGVSSHHEQLLLFYDASGMERTLDGHIRVWAKGLSLKSVNRVLNAKKLPQPLLDRVASKVAAGYRLSYSDYAKVTYDQYLNFVTCEEIADAGDIQPTMRILYDLDCAGRMFRELTIAVDTGGKSGSSDKPREWKHIPPETNTAALAKLVCPRT